MQTLTKINKAAPSGGDETPIKFAGDFNAHESGKKKHLRRAILFTLICVILYCALGCLYVGSMTKMLRREALTMLSESAQQMAVTVRTTIQMRLDGLQILSRSLCASPMGLSQLQERLSQELTAQNYSALAVVDDEGVWIDGFGQAYRVNQQDAFQRVLETGKPCVSSLVLFNDQDSLILMVPMLTRSREGKLFRALAAVYTLDDVERLIMLNAFDDQAYPFVIKDQGNMVIPSRSQYAQGITYNFYEYLQQNAHFESDSLDTKRLNTVWHDKKSIQLVYRDTRDKPNGELMLADLTKIGVDDWILVTPVPAHTLTRHADLFMEFTIGITILLALLFGGGTAYIFITRQKSSSRLEQLAYVDQLTGGYNSTCFRIKAREMLDRANASAVYALVYSNIVNFKLYNDWYGFEKGDEIICRINTCITRMIDERHEVFGRATDHFCMLVRYENPQEIAQRLEGIVRDLKDPNLFVEFGIYVVEQRDMSIPMLEDRATLALKNEIKYRNRQVSIAFYDAQLHKQMQEEKELENMMDTALAAGEFQVYIQPKYDLKGKRICGGEALVRWNSPDRGFLSPDSFIPLFERNGFIVQLDQYMFRRVCELQTQWKNKGLECVPISVNLSRIHFANPLFLETFRAILEENNLPGNLLEIELTETIIYENMNRMRDIVEEIHTLGMACDMDDFGSGYSSLNMLKDVAVDCLKLDKAFFVETQTQEMLQKQRCIIESVVQMANKIGMSTVAEGVESLDQVDFLSEIGCNAVQGYVFYKPMPADDFAKLLKNPHKRNFYS